MNTLPSKNFLNNGILPIPSTSQSYGDSLNIASYDSSGNPVLGYFDAITITGPTGPVGVTGLQGIQGQTGVRGITGIRGITGLQGPVGSDAGVSITGPQGITGAQGIQGETGLNIAGVTGLQGITGSQGIQGATGVVGATGPTGGTEGNVTEVVPAYFAAGIISAGGTIVSSVGIASCQLINTGLYKILFQEGLFAISPMVVCTPKQRPSLGAVYTCVTNSIFTNPYGVYVRTLSFGTDASDISFELMATARQS